MSLVGAHIKTLKRRLLFLEAKLAAGQFSETSAPYLKAERSALLWALNVIEKALFNGKPEDEKTH